MSEPIKLPRVSQEDLVEGERYLVRVGHNGKVREEIAYARPYGTHGKFSFMVGQDWFADEVEAIGGPLPKFEIEET